MKKNILLGVCAGISSYKTCQLVRLLVKDGFTVKVIMTISATKFVTPLVFENLSGNKVYVEMFEPITKEKIEHIDLANWSSICVIAPVTANTLSKISLGICDNLLTTVICALPETTKVLFSPAMNENMWNNFIIKENISKLQKRENYIIIPPGQGELACGAYGQGRMAEPEDIFKKIKTLK